MDRAQGSVVLTVLIFGLYPAYAQEQITRLHCSGTASFYDRTPAIHDVKIDGIYLEIGTRLGKVAGSTGWNGEFEIRRNDQASIFLCHPSMVSISAQSIG
jgi:hypothetical protein